MSDSTLSRTFPVPRDVNARLSVLASVRNGRSLDDCYADCPACDARAATETWDDPHRGVRVTLFHCPNATRKTKHARDWRGRDKRPNTHPIFRHEERIDTSMPVLSDSQREELRAKFIRKGVKQTHVSRDVLGSPGSVGAILSGASIAQARLDALNAHLDALPDQVSALPDQAEQQSNQVNGLPSQVSEPEPVSVWEDQAREFVQKPAEEPEDEAEECLDCGSPVERPDIHAVCDACRESGPAAQRPTPDDQADAIVRLEQQLAVLTGARQELERDLQQLGNAVKTLWEKQQTVGEEVVRHISAVDTVPALFDQVRDLQNKVDRLVVDEVVNQVIHRDVWDKVRQVEQLGQQIAEDRPAVITVLRQFFEELEV